MALPPSGQPDLPPGAGARIHITSMATWKNVAIMGNGNIHAHGGNGKWATFVVAPNNGFLRLDNIGTPGRFLAVGKMHVRHGPGGPACELSLLPVGPGVFSTVHAHGHGSLAFDQSGNPLQPGPFQDPRGHFRYTMA